MFSSFRAAGASIRLEHHLCPAALEPPTDAAPRAPKDASAGVFAVHTGMEPRGRLAPHAVAFMALAPNAGVAKSPDAIATLAGVLAVDTGREVRKRAGHGRAPRHSSEGAFALDTGPGAVAPEDPSAARTNSVSHNAEARASVLAVHARMPRLRGAAPDAGVAFSLDSGAAFSPDSGAPPLEIFSPDADPPVAGIRLAPHSSSAVGPYAVLACENIDTRAAAPSVIEKRRNEVRIGCRGNYAITTPCLIIYIYKVRIHSFNGDGRTEVGGPGFA